MKKTNASPSLALRLTIWFTFSTFLLVFIATISLYWSLERALNSQDRILILDRAQTMTHLIQSASDLNRLKERVEKEWSARKFERVYVKVLNSRQEVVAETTHLDFTFESVLPDLPPVNLQALDQSAFKLVQIREPSTERTFKIAKVKIWATPHDEMTALIALDRTGEETVLATYRSRFLMILLITFIVAASIGRRIAIKAVQPLVDIASTARRITSTTLHQRINIDDVPAELFVLVRTFNEMLDRLDESFERLSRFSQDIAHDLRTPVNNLRGELEVALGRVRTPDEYRDVLGSCLEESSKLTNLIDSLLFLARAESPSSHLSIQTLNVKKEILDLVEFFETSASEKGLKLEIQVEEDLSLRADPLLFQRVLANLITNALRYSEKQGSIILRGTSGEKTVIIEVIDHGIGIPTDHITKVFDRFYRVDAARSSETGGVGLGLSIVKSVMQLHKGKVEIFSDTGQGTRVRLEFQS